MGAIRISETSVIAYKTTRRHNPEDVNPSLHRPEKLKFLLTCHLYTVLKSKMADRDNLFSFSPVHKLTKFAL
jgi:hypothetical protein